MRNRTIYTILSLACILGFWLFENFYTPATYSNSEENPKVFNVELLPSSTTGVIVHHANFSLSYHEKYEQAEWVAYTLEKAHLTYDNRKRPYFIEDPKVKSKSADWRNYKRSGYDRGHLCPAGDRRFSKYAYNETFYTSNISPQKNDFNAGVWNRLEKKIRFWVKKEGSFLIITGGVLERNLGSIGDEDVAVPDHFYKIIAKGNGADLKLIGFLFPHKESNKSLQNFIVSVDEIERLTGIDFFEKLPDSLEDKLESQIVTENWRF
ncbi:MAG: DNA/RNA non-specific endonuclease [Cellulophaga sp.]